MKTKITFFLMLAFMICSCSERTNLVNYTSDVANIHGSVSGFRLTRAHDTSWGAHDTIGIFATSERSRFGNMPYVHTSDNDFDASGDKISFMYDDNELTFTAYYPYLSDEKVDFQSYNFSTEHQTPAAQDSIDILFADAITADCNEPDIDFLFVHKMSKVVLNIKPGEGMTMDKLKDDSRVLKLSGLKHAGEFNIQTGVLSVADGAPVVEQMVIDANPNVSVDKLTYTLYFLPQISQNVALEVELSGNTYYVELPLPEKSQFDNQLQANMCCSYNLVLSREAITIEDISINDWTNKDMGDFNMHMGDKDFEPAADDAII